MYDAVNDPYCYEGTTALKNFPDIQNQDALDAFEAIMTAQRSDEPLPKGRMGVAQYRAIHHHLFQDIYPWAGAYRTVRIGKGGSAFCYPEHISGEMQKLFDDLRHQKYLKNLSPSDFAVRAARFLSELNAIHPFREGNGRTQVALLLLLASHAGHPLDTSKLIPKRFLSAMITSFEGDERPLVSELNRLIA